MLRSLVLAAAVLVAAPLARAQWSTDPATPLTIADRPTGQAQPKVSRFDYGGGYISWLGGGGDGYDVYLQRLDAQGNPQWGADGIRVADRSYSSTQDYGLDAFPPGDAYLAFRIDVGGTAQVGARRIAPDGTSIWGDLVASADPAGVNSPKIAQMTDGGAVVGWTSGDGALRLQRLDASGARMWGADGVAIVPPSGVFFIGGLVSYGSSVVVSGQAQLSFADRRLWAQKFDAAGTPLWGTTPVNVSDGTTGVLQFGYFPAPVPDFDGGAIFTWYAVSGVAGAQSYVQVVRPDGSFAFPQNGAEVAVTPGRVRVAPDIVVAANGGRDGNLVVAWVEETPSPSRQFSVVAQRFSPSGQRVWGDGGRVVTPLDDAQISQVRVTWTTEGGPAVAWATGMAPGPMTISGAITDFDLNDFYPPFPIKTAATSVSRLEAPSTLGLAVFAWADGDDPASIQAQHVNWDGRIGPPTATPSVAAGPDAQATLAVAPHPVVGATTVRVTLVQPAAVRLEVLDALGRRVAVVTDGSLGAGDHVLPWDATGLAPGVYLARLSVGDATTARRVVVAR